MAFNDTGTPNASSGIDNYGSLNSPSHVRFANIQEDDQDYGLEEPSSPLFSTKNWNTRDFYSFKPLGTPAYRAGFNVVATVVGSGILGLPIALQQGGWTAIIVLCFVGYFANYTGRMLIKAMYSQKRRGKGKLATYYHIGVGAFGRWGGVVVMFCQYMVLLSAGILYLILAGLNEKTLFENWGVPEVSVKAYIAANVAVVILPVVALKTMKEISIIALFGLIASAFVVLVVVILGFMYPAHHASHKWIDLEKYPYAFATIVFSFGGHSVFPTIQHHMKSTKNFNRMFNLSFVVIMALYLPTVIVAYYAFGSTTQSPILNSLKKGWLNDAATVAITIHVLLVIPILLNPVALDIEGMLGLNPKSTSTETEMEEDKDISKRDSDDCANNARETASHKKHIETAQKVLQKFEFVFRVIIRTTLLCCQAGIAMLVPHFADFMALVGASAVTSVVFFIPCMAHLKLNWPRLSIIEVLLNLGILEAAWVGSTVGILQAVTSLLNDIFSLHLQIPTYVFWIILANSAAIGFCAVLFVFALIVVGWQDRAMEKKMQVQPKLCYSSSSSSSSSTESEDDPLLLHS